jgi:hemerythrin-like domain-containing protein
MPQDLITTLIAQHNELRAHMQHLDALALPGKEAASETISVLTAFKRTLMAHMHLENKQFYPIVLKKFKQKETETKNLLRFMEEMENIGKTVLLFCDRYKTVEAVAADGAGYRRDLKAMIGVLMIRISSEEDGIFLYW